MIETQDFRIDTAPPFPFHSVRETPSIFRDKNGKQDVETRDGRSSPAHSPGQTARRHFGCLAPRDGFHRRRLHHYFLAIFFLCACLAPAARSETVNQVAERQAREFLLPCPKMPRADFVRCTGSQKQFVESWLISLTGDTYFMGDIVGFLDPLVMPGQPAPTEEFVRHDKLQACAWRYVRWRRSLIALYQPTYKDDWTTYCVGQGYPDAATQQAAVVTLVDRLDTGAPVLTPQLRATRYRFQDNEPNAAALLAEALRLHHHMAEKH